MAVAAGTILFVPGSRPDRFAKALASGADVVCVDLEDAVAADSKAQARLAAIEAMASGDSRIAIRINGLETAHGLQDLLALKESGRAPRLLFVPMVESVRDVRIVASVLDIDSPRIVPLIETASGLRAAHEIAAAPGVAAMMFGGGDLSAQLGVELSWEPLAAARGQFILACGGAGVATIDVPFTRLDDSAGLEEECLRAKTLGFTAKAAIHPGQVETIGRIFMPSDAELSRAHEALEAYRSAGGAAVRHKGEMLEAPLIRRYEAILASREKLNA
ncbi:MAG TPA: CoA ester lyase [Allosphingosinicella sp.]|nr:CoA ester lyase [Allosphingosinicella sp.]